MIIKQTNYNAKRGHEIDSEQKIKHITLSNQVMHCAHGTI